LLPSRSAPAAVDSVPVHQVHVAISENQWVVKTPVGRLWYQAGDLDEKDIVSFVVIDAHCRGGTLEIHTNELLWGAYEVRSGAWVVLWAVCESHDVCLGAKWVELAELNTCPPV
jgi:hypothetical protein